MVHAQLQGILANFGQGNNGDAQYRVWTPSQNHATLMPVLPRALRRLRAAAKGQPKSKPFPRPCVAEHVRQA